MSPWQVIAAIIASVAKIRTFPDIATERIALSSSHQRKSVRIGTPAFVRWARVCEGKRRALLPGRVTWRIATVGELNMYSRTTTAQIAPERFDEAVSFVRDQFAPAAAQQPGFLGFTLLVNRDQHSIMGITYWESEHQMTASSSASGYYQQMLATYRSYVDGTASTGTWDVGFKDFGL